MGSEVELRIDPDAGPKPDVIATRDPAQIPEGSYPTRAMEVVVGILSPDDKAWVIEEHCEKYSEWGFSLIYLVHPERRRVVQWQTGGAHVPVEMLAGVPVSAIWAKLDRKLKTGSGATS